MGEHPAAETAPWSTIFTVLLEQGLAGGRPVRNLEGMTVAASLFRFEDSYAREVPGLSVPWTAASARAPELRVLNEELAVELGVDPAALREPSGVALRRGRSRGGYDGRAGLRRPSVRHVLPPPRGRPRAAAR